MVKQARRFIITGGPGSGKSTLLGALRKEGLRCYAEVSRELIRQQAARPDGVLPWRNLPAFARLAFSEMLRQHDHADGSAGICFFDRGVPDIFGYLRHGGYEIPGDYLAAHARCRYERVVFILPPWEEIYVNDSERPQRFEESAELYHAIGNTYATLGYTLVEVPKMSVDRRCSFILEHLEKPENRPLYRLADDACTQKP